MEQDKISRELVAVAKELLGSDVRTAAEAMEDTDEETEDPAFMKKVMGLRPATLKKLNRFRNRKVKQLSDRVSLQMTVNDLIDILIQLTGRV